MKNIDVYKNRIVEAARRSFICETSCAYNSAHFLRALTHTQGAPERGAIVALFNPKRDTPKQLDTVRGMLIPEGDLDVQDISLEKIRAVGGRLAAFMKGPTGWGITTDEAQDQGVKSRYVIIGEKALGTLGIAQDIAHITQSHINQGQSIVDVGGHYGSLNLSSQDQTAFNIHHPETYNAEHSKGSNFRPWADKSYIPT